METKDVVKSQVRAALEMLRQAVVACPDTLWHNAAFKNQFWHIAYHTLFYAHIYLHPSLESFVPWDGHRHEARSLEGAEAAAGGPLYSRAEILDYHRLILAQVDGLVDSLDLEGPSGFYWLPFGKLELQFYAIRHIQQHTGELCERLGGTGDVEVDWVDSVP